MESLPRVVVVVVGSRRHWEFPPSLSPRRRVLANIEVQMSGCGAGPGGPPTSWCPPFSGANAAEAQHHNPTRPRLLRIFPLFFLSFFPFILPCLIVLFFYPPPSYSFLLCLHSSLFHPSSSFLLCLLPSFLSILLPYLLFPPSIHVPLQHYHLPSSVCSYSVLSRSRLCPGTRKESDSAGHPRNTSITIFYKSLMHSVVTTAARRAFGELPAAASCSRRAA